MRPRAAVENVLCCATPAATSGCANCSRMAGPQPRSTTISLLIFCATPRVLSRGGPGAAAVARLLASNGCVGAVATAHPFVCAPGQVLCGTTAADSLSTHEWLDEHGAPAARHVVALHQARAQRQRVGCAARRGEDKGAHGHVFATGGLLDRCALAGLNGGAQRGNKAACKGVAAADGADRFPHFGVGPP